MELSTIKNINFVQTQPKMCITVNNRTVDISIKRSVSVDHWNQARESCTSSGKVRTEINLYVDTMRAKVLKTHRELEIDSKRVTADAIRDKLYSRTSRRKQLLKVHL